MKEVDHAFSNLHCELDGFHLTLESWKMHGKLFGNLLSVINEAWRPSESMQNWFLHPCDPNQTESEWNILLKVHVYWAAERYIKATGRTQCTVEDDWTFFCGEKSTRNWSRM